MEISEALNRSLTEGIDALDDSWIRIVAFVSIPAQKAYQVYTYGASPGDSRVRREAGRQLLTHSGGTDVSDKRYTQIVYIALAGVLENVLKGDYDAALAESERVRESGVGDAVARADFMQGVVFRKQNDFGSAYVSFDRAFKSGHFEAAARAAGMAGRLIEEADVSKARNAYENVMSWPNEDAAAGAGFLLGRLLITGGERAEARTAFQRSTSAFAPGISESARRILEML